MTVFNKISDKEASGKVKEIFDEIKEARQILKFQISGKLWLTVQKR